MDTPAPVLFVEPVAAMPPRLSPLAAARRWSGLPQLVVHQAAWWACVLWMGWAGPAAMLAFVGLHLWVVRQRWKTDLALVLVATVLGAALDNLLAFLGCVTYEGRLWVGLSPLWLVALWTGFGATLRHSQSALVRSAPVAVLAGAVGGPLAYRGGEALGRLDVVGTPGWCAVSVTWGVVLLLLQRASRVDLDGEVPRTEALG